VLEGKQALAERVHDDPAAQAALAPILREAMSTQTAKLMERGLHYTPRTK